MLALICCVALAQDSEPRRWTHLPVGSNFVGASYLYTSGDIHVDPVLRIEDASVRLHTIVAGYNHYFGLGDMTARVDVQVPVQFGRWKGLLDGVPTSVSRDGLADPRVRFSLNFLGSPALEGEAFQNFMRSQDQHTVVGAALALRVPLGEYDSDKLINLGENRFSVEPQLGVVHTSGSWSGELTGSVFFYTPNTISSALPHAARIRCTRSRATWCGSSTGDSGSPATSRTGGAGRPRSAA